MAAPPGNGKQRLHLRSPLERIRRWAEAVQEREQVGGPKARLKRFVAKTIQVVVMVARLEVISRLQLHAQALTYDTMLAIVPLLAVIFAAIAGFGGLEEMRASLEDFIISNLVGTGAQAEVAAHIHDFVANIRTGTFSAVSIVILIFSVMSLLGHIESAINVVFGSKTERPWVTRLLSYWAALTLGPIFLLASLALTAALQTSWVAGMLASMGFGGLMVRALPLLTTWTGFTLTYLVVPRVRVRLSAAIFAAVIAGSLWSVAKYGYAIYAKNAITVQNIYGSLAAVPLFILWIYVSWLLVLLGAQLAFAYQHASTYQKEEAGQDAAFAYRERVACRAFLEVARDFFAGRPPTDIDRVSHDIGIPRRLLQSVFTDLKHGGFVREVEDTSSYVPARELEQVTVGAVVDHLRRGIGAELPMVHDPGTDALDAIFVRLDEALTREAGHISFKELVQRLEHPRTEPGEPPRETQRPD